jgi:CRISPR/Cas system CSM-associated protein Csm3 (group 7 of RAMP superfamily)
MNPYDFVPLGEQGPLREKVNQHHKFAGESGHIVCTLTARTPIFVPQYRADSADRVRTQHEHLQFCHDAHNRLFIPGTSLKGVIRNVAEAVSNSCLPLPNRLVYERETVTYSLPTGFLPCKDVNALCPACRLFGMLNRGTVFAGNVSVQDAMAQANYETAEVTLSELSTPKPRHKPFYTKRPNDNKPPIRGRKFYYHRPQGVIDTTVKTHRNKTVTAVLPPAQFIFEVEYTNLKLDDLKLLLFALTLWDDACHKVGMGKPIGLGSAKFTITALQQLDYRKRYTQSGGGWSSLTGEALSAFVQSQTAAYRNSRDANLQDLHRIWHWDEHSTNTVHYPGQAWFKAHPQEPLEGAP